MKTRRIEFRSANTGFALVKLDPDSERRTPWTRYVGLAPGGNNVLFLDGHVEFVEYGGGRFPVTPAHAGVPTNNPVVISIHDEE